MDSGRFFFRPNSFHLVPGQKVLSLSEALSKGDCWDVHYHWELQNGGVASAWCSSVIKLGSIAGHTTSSSITSYPVIKALLTKKGSWPPSVVSRNPFTGGSDECAGTGAIALIDGEDQCTVNIQDFLSECDNPAPIANIPEGVPPACLYKDCNRDVICNPCRGGPEAYGGPSEFLPTTYWSENFEDFLKDFMGVNQPDEDTHGCARTISGRSSAGATETTANVQCSLSRECSDDYCGGRGLDAPSALAFDTPSSASDTWKDIGSHGSNRGVSWNFTSYEMRYTNMEDPGDPEYSSQPDPNCNSVSEGLWSELLWFQDGLKKIFPKCSSDVSDKCKESSGLFKEEKNKATGKEELKPVPNVTRDTPTCVYDPCWIGWTGGGKLPEEPEVKDNKIEKTRWIRYYDRDLENQDCPPKKLVYYESEKYGGLFQQLYDGDIIPVPGWVEPENRVYDYWCLIAEYANCLNVNLLLENGEQAPFSQKTTFFNDPAFMSSRLRAGSLSGWRTPPCVENEVDYSSHTAIPVKTYCWIGDLK